MSAVEAGWKTAFKTITALNTDRFWVCNKLVFFSDLVFLLDSSCLLLEVRMFVWMFEPEREMGAPDVGVDRTAANILSRRVNI